MRSVRYVALLLVAAFVLSGCNIIRVNPERDGEQVVAVVNGEQITKKQVYDAAGITWGQKVETWDDAAYRQKKETTLDTLIENSVIKQKAKELGYYTFTAEEQKSIDDAVASYKTSNYEKLLADYKTKAQTNPSIKPEDAANADIEKYRQEEEFNTAASKAQKVVTDPVTPTDADVQSAYTSQLTEQKTQFDANPGQVSQYDMYGAFGYPPVVYYPSDGFVRVKEIMVSIPQDKQTEISTLRTDKKDAEADKLRDEELKKIAATANEALTKAKATNGDLVKLSGLIAEYNKDTTDTPETPGFLMLKDTSATAKEIDKVVSNLTAVGVPSELVSTDNGYSIVWLSEIVSKGEVPLDKIKTRMTDYTKASLQSNEWQKTITAWKDEYKLKITRYLDRLHN